MCSLTHGVSRKYARGFSASVKSSDCPPPAACRSLSACPLPAATGCSAATRSCPERIPLRAGPACKTTAKAPIPPSGIRSPANFLLAAAAPHCMQCLRAKQLVAPLLHCAPLSRTGICLYPPPAARPDSAAPKTGAETSSPPRSAAALHGFSPTGFSIRGTQWDRRAPGQGCHEIHRA